MVSTVRRTNRVNEIFCQLRNKWGFNFNAGESAVLGYGKSLNEKRRNAIDRCFKLGPDRVCEKKEYDHVGIKANLYNDSETKGLEKIGKS